MPKTRFPSHPLPQKQKLPQNWHNHYSNSNEDTIRIGRKERGATSQTSNVNRHITKFVMQYIAESL